MPTLAELPRLLRTVRHLRISQMRWRAQFMLQRRWEQTRWSGMKRRVRGALPSELAVRDDLPAVFAHRGDRLPGTERLAELESGRLTLLNEQRPFRGGADWRLTGDTTGQRLWTYHLHYHEWLLDLIEHDSIRERGSPALLDVVRDWIETCELGARGFAHFPWNSYTIATRVEWWVRIWAALDGLEPQTARRWLRSLAEQSEYLATHVEWDLRANHLLRDARGLAWAGRFFAGEPGRRWMAQATRLAGEQVLEQILPDGGQFERSAMYHVHAMEDIGALAALIEDGPAATLMRETWSRMADWLRWMRHPDGEIPLFNDAALGAVAHPEQILRSAVMLGLEVDVERPRGGRWFEQSGLFVWHGEPWTLFFDAGPLGPDYQPAHGHADTLTLECSLGAERLVVDPGTFVYDNDDVRRYDRSTAAHNTVTIDGESSSEVWHIFRVGRRAQPRDARARFDAASFSVEASHDGYDRLPGAPRHSRRIELTAAGVIEIGDRVAGGERHRLEGGLLIAPGWSVEPHARGWRLDGPGGRAEVSLHGPDGLRPVRESRPYHPEFGREVQATWLGWSYEGGLPVEIRTTLTADGR